MRRTHYTHAKLNRICLKATLYHLFSIRMARLLRFIAYISNALHVIYLQRTISNNEYFRLVFPSIHALIILRS